MVDTAAVSFPPLGTGVAVVLAATHPVAAIILVPVLRERAGHAQTTPQEPEVLP